MSRNSWIVPVVTLLLVAAFLLDGAAMTPVALAASAAPRAAPAAAPAAAPEQVVAKGAYVWNYSVKFVCGLQTSGDAATGGQIIGEPPVKPGNYATEINIHNYNYREVKVRKKLLLLVKNGSVVAREPDVARPDPANYTSVVLGPDFATMDDCNGIWKLAGASPTAPNPPITIGFLVILSPIDLDVDAVYTAAVSNKVPGANIDQAAGISIDVERVTGKRVFVPANFANQFP